MVQAYHSQLYRLENRFLIILDTKNILFYHYYTVFYLGCTILVSIISYHINMLYYFILDHITVDFNRGKIKYS